MLLRRHGIRTLARSLGFTLASAAAAANEIVLEPRWISGGTGSSVGDFGVPESVAFDAQGRVVVTDKGRMMLHVYDRHDGRPLFDVGSLGTSLGSFDRPNGIAVDAAGRILVVEQRNRRVQVLDQDYRPIAAYRSGFQKAMGIALDGAGHIYVTDEARADVQVLDPQGRFLWSFAESPRLDRVESIEIDALGQRILVCDESRSLVNVYDLQGRYLRSFGGQGTGPGQFGNDPNAVRVDGRGRIYVNDQGNLRVNVYTPDLVPLASIHNPRGAFESADGVALSEPYNLLIVCDQGHNRLVAWDLGEIQCRLAQIELGANAATLGDLAVAFDVIGTATPAAGWADGKLGFTAHAPSHDATRRERAIVHVRSQRDPRGVTVVLDETAPESGLFRGQVQLGETSDEATGRLATHHADHIEAHAAGGGTPVFTVVVTPDVALVPRHLAARTRHGIPRLDWTFVDPAGRQQTHYETRWMDAAGNRVWESGIVQTAHGSCEARGITGVPARVELRLAAGRIWSEWHAVEVARNAAPSLGGALSPRTGARLGHWPETLRVPLATDPEGDPLRCAIEMILGDGTLLRSPALFATDDAWIFNPAEVPLPPGATLRWRAIVSDGLHSVATEWANLSRNHAARVPGPEFSGTARLSPGAVLALAGGPARVGVFDVRGRQVRGADTDREGRWTWDARDDRGRVLPRGIYWLHARHGATPPVRHRVLWLGPSGS